MASRAPGRRRDPGPSGPLDRPSLLMLDYLETGQFPGRPAGGPGRPRPGTTARPGGRGGSVRGRRRRRRFREFGSGVRRLTTDGRVLAVAAIVAVALAVLVGTSMPLRSTQAGPGRPSAAPSEAPQSPGTSAASPSPAQPPVTSSAAASPSAPPGGTSPGGTSPGVARSNGGGSRQAMPAATTGTPAGASPASSAAATRRAARLAPAVSVVVVTFSATSRGAGIFQGKVQIVNDGPKPLANWQVAVALPGDRVVAVANASGLVVHGILLLEPASGAAPVPAAGGVLNVFFVAVGSQPLSGACTFNQLPCG